MTMKITITVAITSVLPVGLEFSEEQISHPGDGHHVFAQVIIYFQLHGIFLNISLPL